MNVQTIHRDRRQSARNRRVMSNIQPHVLPVFQLAQIRSVG
jgi:hypothetical protein